MNTEIPQQSTEKNNTFLYTLVFIVIVTVFGVGWWLAQNNAEEEVRDFFDEREYLDNISYEDTTLNPLTGTLTLSQIEIEPSRQGLENPILIDALKIYNMDINGSIPEHIHFSANGVHINLIENAKAFYTPAELSGGDQPISNMMLLGYYDLLFDYEMEIVYDEDERELGAQVFLGGGDLGYVEIETKIARLKKRLFQFFDCVTDVISDKKNNSLQGNIFIKFRKCDFEKTIGELTNTSLAKLKLNYSDDGLLKRYNRYENIKHFYMTGVLRGEDEVYSQDSIHEDVIKFKRQGASKEIAENIVESFANFMNDPDEISIETNLEKPIQIKKLFGKELGKVFKLVHVKANN